MTAGIRRGSEKNETRHVEGELHACTRLVSRGRDLIACSGILYICVLLPERHLLTLLQQSQSTSELDLTPDEVGQEADGQAIL